MVFCSGVLLLREFGRMGVLCRVLMVLVWKVVCRVFYYSLLMCGMLLVMMICFGLRRVVVFVSVWLMVVVEFWMVWMVREFFVLDVVVILCVLCSVGLLLSER